MKAKRILAAIAAAALVLASLAGCAANEKPVASPAVSAAVENKTPQPQSVSITDMMGENVALDAPAAKVVALTAADCEILYAVGAGDTLVGRGEYCDYPAEATEAATVQSGSETNIEQIIALKPDLVLVGTMDQTKEQVQQLKDAGIAVAVSNAQDIEGVYKAIEMIGALTGKGDSAAALIESMKKSFAEISARAAENEGKTVYFEVSPLQYGLWTAGADTFMDEIAAMLGFKNCFSDVSGWAEISEEQIIERDPDYIVTISMYYGDGPTPEEEIMARKGWDSLKAVKNKAILNLKNNELSRPGPRLEEGARMLYEFIFAKDEAKAA